MKFSIGIWDHCRYVQNTAAPYDEMAQHLERMRNAGVTLTDIYLPEVISLDDYCRAASNCGMLVEARITQKWAGENVVLRTLTEAQRKDMEERYGICLTGPCGNHPANRALYAAGLERLLSEFGSRLYSVQLDFIRNDNYILLREYPCQCDACRALYRRYFGMEIPDEKALQDPAVFYKLSALRNDNITATVQALRAVADRYGIRLSIAARANYVNSADITAPPVWGLGPAVLEGQDWVKWLDNQYIDAVYPMNYHTDIKLFQSVLNDHLRLLDNRSDVLYPGIGVNSSMGINPPDTVREHLEIVRQAGLPGSMLFNKTNIYSDDYLAVIKDLTA